MNQNLKISKENYGHILVVSCPLQGHEAPLIKLSHQIVKFGSKVSFLTEDFMHDRMAAATTDSKIEVVLIPDGLELEDDRKDLEKLCLLIWRICLRKKYQDINEKISGIVIDAPWASMLKIPNMMGIKSVIYWDSTLGCRPRIHDFRSYSI